MSANTTTQKKTFQADVKRVLDIVTRSLYTDKKVFLRELVSNASDAIERLRFEALTNPSLLETTTPRIEITIDKDQKCLTITDQGIGMNQSDLANLGTIAKSGTKEVLDKMGKEESKVSQLIGQFGVGFYSAFVVAKEVVVETRRAGTAANEAACWRSSGDGEYEVSAMEKHETGTSIHLYLKDDAEAFLDPWHVKQVVKEYSQHLSVPVVFMSEEVVADEDAKEGDTSPTTQEDVLNDSEETLWIKAKKDITKDQYQAFYGSITGDPQEPLTWVHQRIEGSSDFTMLLYIPKYAPFDLYMRERTQGVKLYVKRVFIMDDAEKLMPMYLRFVKGLVDANDLPLNVSRELLQDDKKLDAIRGGCVKRVLTKLEKLAKDAPEDYQTFWDAFGAVLKEGPAEDYQNRERLFKLCRFASTHEDNPQQVVSLQDYVGRMKPEQSKIYYLIADNVAAAKNSPHLEYFKAQGLEVLLLSDKVDEWLMSHLTEFDGKPLQSIMQGDLESVLNDQKDSETNSDATQADDQTVPEEKTGPHAAVLTQLETALTDVVKAVRVTSRLTDSPCCLVADQNEMSQHLKRLLASAGQVVPESKPVLELNMDHPLVQRLVAEQDDAQFGEWGRLLFEQAQLLEGASLQDPASFVKRMNRLMAPMLQQD